MNTNYAGFWLRFVAVVIDGIIIGVIRSLLIAPILATMGIGVVSNLQNMDGANSPEAVMGMLAPIMALAGVVSLISTAVWVLYYAFMESSKFQASIGKLALGLIVIDTEGNKLDFTKALIRSASKIVSGMIMMIGFIMAGFTDKKQGLHDLIAGTLVVKKPSQAPTTTSTN